MQWCKLKAEAELAERPKTTALYFSNPFTRHPNPSRSISSGIKRLHTLKDVFQIKCIIFAVSPDFSVPLPSHLKQSASVLALRCGNQSHTELTFKKQDSLLGWARKNRECFYWPYVDSTYLELGLEIRATTDSIRIFARNYRGQIFYV